MSSRDKWLIQAALDQVDDLGLHEAAAVISGEAGKVSHETIARWRRGEGKRLSREKRKILTDFLKRRVPEIHIVSHEDSETGGEGAGAVDLVEEVLDLLEKNSGTRAALRRVPPKRLIQIAYALCEHWPARERQRLDALREQVLRQSRTIPIDAIEHARAAAEALRIANQVSQERQGLPATHPPNQQRKLPRRRRGHRRA